MNLRLTGSLAVLLCLSAVMLAGCQGRVPDGPKGTVPVRFLATGSFEEIRILKDVIKDFEKDSPGIKVKLDVASGDYYTLLFTQIAGGVPPDVFFIQDRMFRVMAEKGALEDLSHYVQRDKSGTLDDFFDKSLQALTYSGKVYALPKDMGSLVLFYNKDLFDSEGLSYPDETWTWETLVERGKKLTRIGPSGRPVRFGFFAYRQIERWATFVYQNGGSIFNEEGTRCLLDTPEATEAIQFFADLALEHRIMPDFAQARDMTSSQGELFTSGLVAMTMDGRWMVPEYNKADFRWNVAPLPNNKQRGTFTHVSGYGISSGSKCKEEAWNLLKHLTSRKVQTAMVKEGLLVPARKSIAESEVFLTPDIPPAHDEVFLKANRYGHLLFANPFMQRGEEIQEINRCIDLICLGKMRADGKDFAEMIRKINDNP